MDNGAVLRLIWKDKKMSVWKKGVAPLAAAVMLSACAGLGGGSGSGVLGGLGVRTDSPATSPAARFRCDNGYRVLVVYKSDDHIVVSFNNGKDTFIAKTYRNGGHYANDLDNLRWREEQGRAEFTYPDSDYRSSGRLLHTVCHRR